MLADYFDTSALAKRYVVEVGSAWVQALVTQQSGQTIYTSVLTQPELVSALQRRVREGLLEALEAERLAQQVLEHMTQSYALAANTAVGIQPTLSAAMTTARRSVFKLNWLMVGCTFMGTSCG